MKSSNRIISICLLLFAFLNVAAQDFFTVSGVVRDRLTRRPLEYVTITLVDHNIGTVSNADGSFSLKIPKNLNASHVECSHIGYTSFRIPVKGENISGVDALMSAHAATINDVIIRGWDAYYLVVEAIGKIPQNYCASPTQLTGFYRETVQKRRTYINITEAVIDMYKTAYTENTDRDRVQILKGRKLLSQRSSDTLAVKLLGGPNLSIFVDVVKNPDVLLDKETLSDFSFRMEDMTYINGRDQYVVTFEPRVVRPYPLYVGTFYIDKESLAFTRAEFRLDMTDRNKASEMILRKKPFGLRFRPEEVSYVINYQERGGINYLSYIRNEIAFRCDWRRRLFSTNYHIVSEMVVTDVNMDNVVEIPRREAFRPNQILGDKVADFFDEDFWGAYNIIEPTESLETAVERLKKQQRN